MLASGGYEPSIRLWETSKNSSENELLHNISQALNVGEQQWNRSKIMLVGQGFGGKTSLSRSLMGKTYKEEVVSTCGIGSFAVETNVGHLGELETPWKKLEVPETNIFESTIARIINNQKNQSIEPPLFSADPELAGSDLLSGSIGASNFSDLGDVASNRYVLLAERLSLQHDSLWFYDRRTGQEEIMNPCGTELVS
jgi:hypothetical protein